MISTYMLLSISRLIISFFEKIITPKISLITDKSSIVLKSDYKIIQVELEKLEKRIQDERESRLKAQNENEILEKRILELLTITASNSKSSEDNTDESKAAKILKKLKKDKSVEEFNKAVKIILSEYTMAKSQDSVQNFIMLGLIKPGGTHQGNGQYKFELSSLGEDVHDLIINEQLK